MHLHHRNHSLATDFYFRTGLRLLVSGSRRDDRQVLQEATGSLQCDRPVRDGPDICSSTFRSTSHRLKKITTSSLSLLSGTLLIFGGIMLNLVPSSMFLRPINIKNLQYFSGRNVDKESLTQSHPPATLTSHLDEISTIEKQFNMRLDSPVQDSTLTDRVQSAGTLVSVNSAGLEGPERDTPIRYSPGGASDGDCGHENLPPQKEGNSTSQPVPCKQPLLDVSLLKDPFFCIFVWSFLFSQLAYFIPTFHLAARAKTLGIDSMHASYLISIAGIIETVSQLLSGWIADQNWIKRYHYHKTYLFLCGITNLLGPLATSFPLLMVYSVSFAIFSGGYLALLLPVLVDLVGVLRLQSSLGFASFFAGIAVIAGPPIAGNKQYFPSSLLTENTPTSCLTLKCVPGNV
uniref:Solute carrier family 16 member 4 n=1 Tax=Pelusios castaneus TaxID=367368 RepID=A0A8C8RFY7_9SAUR